MPKDQQSKQGKMIEDAVADALDRGDTEEAARLAAGHPDPAKHRDLMVQINEHEANAANPVTLDVVADGVGVLAVTDEASGKRSRLSYDADDALRMFALDARPSQLVSFNARTEKHGSDDGVPAADLRFKVNLPSDALDVFHPQLRMMFFHQLGNAADNDLADRMHEAPNLRVPALEGPFKWGKRYAGYSAKLHLGLGDADVVLDDCQLNKISFAPQEGGTCIFEFRLQLHPDERAAGKLAMLIGSQVDLSLTPPNTGGEVEDDEEFEN
jgi:hypothetical protein